MNTESSKWDKDQISKYFELVANQTENYLNEVRRKMGDSSTYKEIYDENLAKFFVYNYLHGKTFLESKQELIDELKRFFNYQIDPPSNAFDKERYFRYRKMFINNLIDSYSK